MLVNVNVVVGNLVVVVISFDSVCGRHRVRHFDFSCRRRKLYETVFRKFQSFVQAVAIVSVVVSVEPEEKFLKY